MQTYQGSCHCGKVKFEIEADIQALAQCNCSICVKKHALMTLIPEAQFKLLEGEDELTLYQFNKKIAKHYFCKTCGIYPFHRPRTKPDFYGINASCLDGVDVSTFPINQANGKALD